MAEPGLNHDLNEGTVPANPELMLRFYLAPGAPNSDQAMANLTAICQEHFPGRYHVEVVDVRKQPRRALDDGILITPTLIRLSPLPIVRIIGNLSQTAQVLRALSPQRSEG